MQLMTKEIEEELKKYPLYSQDGKKKKHFICKFFNPYGAGTWLVSEGEKQESGDWLFFGKVHLFETEWGYFTLSELESVKFPNGTPVIERDLHYNGEEEI